MSLLHVSLLEVYHCQTARKIFSMGYVMSCKGSREQTRQVAKHVRYHGSHTMNKGLEVIS